MLDLRTQADTIVAVSSAPGNSARALVRISGPSAHSALEATLQTMPQTARQLVSARLRSPLPNLPVLASFFSAPASFTGEHMAELLICGHSELVSRTVSHIRQIADVRLAEPGEFTYRAFRYGKLDLTQAEGIAATLSATSLSQLNAAHRMREGELGKFAAECTEKIATLLALVESGIDFSEEDDVIPISLDDLNKQLNQLIQQLTSWHKRASPISAHTSLPRVALIGPPSHGKSTLFNALLGSERALIHEIPGTTRDLLEENLILSDETHNIELTLIDTPGIGETLPNDPLGLRAQERTQSAIDEADLILSVQRADSTNLQWPKLPANTPQIKLTTCLDLGAQHPNSLGICVFTNLGMNELRHNICNMLMTLSHTQGGDDLLLQPRQIECLDNALNHLNALSNHLSSHGQLALSTPEHIAYYLRESLDALAMLGGTHTPDAILGRIFSQFCIGK